MTPERLFSLIDTYGAGPARWPEEWRADAEALVRRGDPAVLRALEGARELDDDLASHRIPAAEGALIRRIVASGPTPPWWRRTGRGARWWLSGVGLVGAGVGGMAAGAMAISLLVPVSTVAVSAADDTSVGTTFGDVRMEGSER